MLERSFQTFQQTHDRPAPIIADTYIRYSSTHEHDTSAAHRAPLGEEEIRFPERKCGRPEDARFPISDGVREHFQAEPEECGYRLSQGWMHTFDDYSVKHLDLAGPSFKMPHRQLPDDWEIALLIFATDAEGAAGRDASAESLNAIAQQILWLIGGSADLAPSTKTRLAFEGAGELRVSDRSGHDFRFGLREHCDQANSVRNSIRIRHENHTGEKQCNLVLSV
jgi:transketolase